MGTATTDFGLDRIGQIAIPVRDLERAVRFYRDTLGMRALFDVPPSMAFFDCGGIRLMLAVPEAPEFDHPASVVYYKVADIRSAHDALATRGAPVVHEPRLTATLPDHALWMAFYRDPEGNLLALMSEVPR